ncbi:MAG: PEGA domain-containing protein [Methanoregulaceae archaeon]|nr:PEGA domain-containing protein [Methanoregulaceae archaeon]
MRSSTTFIIVILLVATAAVSSAMVSTGDVPVVNPGTLPVTQAVPATLPAQPVAPATLPVIPGGGTGYFSINSVPSGGEVYFDGAYWGETPAMVTVSTTGNPDHTIRISLPGYEEWSDSYYGNPKDGQTIPITAQLTPSAQTGNIQVVSTPSGALVTLDRSRSANTPYTFTNIPVGTHEITVFMSGYQDFYMDVNVNKGQTSYVNAVLQPAVTTGTLSVSSSPSGAAVYVDGSYRGVTSTSVGNLVPGSHSVQLILAGYQDWTGTVTISAGATTYLNPTLTVDQQPKYATASITSNPPGATVYSNGVYIGQTSAGSPLIFTQVNPGTYSLLITKSGYQDYSGTQTVVAGQNYNIAVTLNSVQNPTTGGISVISAPSQAEVYLNNAFRGLTPITLDSLTPGSYTVLIKLSGYQDWQVTQQVTAGQTAQISATLIPVSQPTSTPTQTGLLPLTIIAALGVLFIAGRRH